LEKQLNEKELIEKGRGERKKKILPGGPGLGGEDGTPITSSGMFDRMVGLK